MNLECAKSSRKEPVDIFSLEVGEELKLRIKFQPECPEMQTEEDSFVHFDIDFLLVPNPERVPLHRIMGQNFTPEQRKRVFSFRTEWSPQIHSWNGAGPSGDGYLEGRIEQYQTAGLHLSNCHFCLFWKAVTLSVRNSLQGFASEPKEGTVVGKLEQKASTVIALKEALEGETLVSVKVQNRRILLIAVTS